MGRYALQAMKMCALIRLLCQSEFTGWYLCASLDIGIFSHFGKIRAKYPHDVVKYWYRKPNGSVHTLVNLIYVPERYLLDCTNIYLDRY